MSYQALYRQWRPLTFDDVIGQSHIVTPIKNQIMSSTYGHAYIFSGTRGTGKTSTAKILARAVNCLSPMEGNPCNTCEHCLSILEDQFIDVIEMDAASNNSVDDIRELREHIKFSPSKGKFKVYIIDEVHMLSQGAFNALLKTLEEPPEYVIFILATTELQKIPATILSRCQKFDFKRVSYDDLFTRLKLICETLSVAYEEEALQLIIEKSDGAVRDSLSGLDQCLSTQKGSLKTEDVLTLLGIVEKSEILGLIEAMAHSQTHTVMVTLDQLLRQGKDLVQLINGLIHAYRDILIIKTTEPTHHSLLIHAPKEQIENIKALSDGLTKTHVNRALDLLIDLSKSIKYAANKRIVLEASLFKILNPVYDSGLGALIERIERLESGHFVANSSNIPPSDKGIHVKEPKIVEHKAPLKADPIESFIEFKEGDVTFEEIQETYVDFLNRVKDEKKALHPFFVGSRPIEIQGNKCIIGISAENTMFIGVLTNPSNGPELERILSEQVKKNIHISFVPLDEQMQSVDTTEEIMNYFEAYKNVLQIRED